METAGQIFILLASLIAAYSAFQAKETHETQDPDLKAKENSFYVLSLGSIAAALSALGSLTLNPQGPDTGTLLRMLNNLAIYAGAPMMATALISLGLNKPISLAGWGRWLLGLFALFELLRRMSYGEIYLWVLIGFVLIACLIALAVIRHAGARVGLGVVLGGCSAALIAHLNSSPVVTSLALAVSLLGLAFFCWGFAQRKPQ